MIPLRQRFLVDELRFAAESGESLRLQLVREIIKRIKLIQLERKVVATDEMVLEALEGLHRDKERELQLAARYLGEARSHTEGPSGRAP